MNKNKFLYNCMMSWDGPNPPWRYLEKSLSKFYSGEIPDHISLAHFNHLLNTDKEFVKILITWASGLKNNLTEALKDRPVSTPKKRTQRRLDNARMRSHVVRVLSNGPASINDISKTLQDKGKLRPNVPYRSMWGMLSRMEGDGLLQKITEPTAKRHISWAVTRK